MEKAVTHIYEEGDVFFCTNSDSFYHDVLYIFVSANKQTKQCHVLMFKDGTVNKCMGEQFEDFVFDSNHWQKL